MDIEQITFPPGNQKNKRRISREGDCGFLWFLETSWQYMTPRGPREVVSFVVRFPACWWGFRKQMRIAYGEP